MCKLVIFIPDSTVKPHEDGEAHRSLSSLAQLVKAKLRFLSEGKEPVSPVQAMAIQIEVCHCFCWLLYHLFSYLK